MAAIKHNLSFLVSKNAIRDWIRFDLWPDVYEEVRLNLHGRMMQRRSGETWRDVKANSGPTDRGLRLQTSKPGLIAWQKGSSRKAFFVKPKHKLALAFRPGWKWGAGDMFKPGTDGVVFSAGHLIPRWKFTPTKPVFADAIERAGQANIDAMTKRLGKEFRVQFKGGKLTINVPFRGDKGAPRVGFQPASTS